MQTLKVRDNKISLHTYNYDNIIEKIDEIYNLNLDKKYRTLSEIKKILN